MKYRLIHAGQEKTYALIMETGDEPMETLVSFATENGITAARLTAIGAFESVVLGYYEVDRKHYRQNRFNEQMEVLSFIGDIAVKGGAPVAHVHVALGRADASTVGGHLLEARVRPTLEVILVQSPAYLQRVMNREVGLPLIEPRM
jgi:predicted DNA-binding protein with PD1-like motif